MTLKECNAWIAHFENLHRETPYKTMADYYMVQINYYMKKKEEIDG